MDSFTKTVELQVKLLNEGTDVSRPTRALDLGNGLFKLLATDDYDPSDEEWAFAPGQTVRAQPRIGKNGEYLFAIRP